MAILIPDFKKRGCALHILFFCNKFCLPAHTENIKQSGGEFMRIWRARQRTGILLILLPFALFCLFSLPRKAAVAADGAADIPARPKLIALTFDDGPSSVTTPVLLDGLAERGVHATFFLVGSMVADNPDVVRRMAAEGHQIGVHTYDHSSTTGLLDLSGEQFDAQVGVTARMITQLTGQTQFAFRPPYGFVDDRVRSLTPGPIVLWSIDPEDWRDQDARREAELILSQAEDGAIILLHDIFSQSVEAALQVIDSLHQQGYLFVTVDELFAARAIPLERGEVYLSAN